MSSDLPDYVDTDALKRFDRMKRDWERDQRRRLAEVVRDRVRRIADCERAIQKARLRDGRLR